jgi:hypothetical protein
MGPWKYLTSLIITAIGQQSQLSRYSDGILIISETGMDPDTLWRLLDSLE